MSVPFVTLWVGRSLGAVERACLKSILAHGHRLVLYAYEPVEGVPTGAELRDAATILPKDSVVRHRRGSASLFSNWFRYELLRRELGVWIDCDVYMIRSLDLDPPLLFAEQAPGTINGAVLKLPPDSPVLAALLRYFGQKEVPPWLPWRARFAARWRLSTSGGTGIDRMPWGSLGPHALTAVLADHGLATQALPAETLYPVPWQRADWILDPELGPEDVTTARTSAIHLWNECIKPFKEKPAPPGSFLHRLQAEGSVS